MWVCHCKAVSDRHIRAVLDSGARDVADVGLRCGAGTGCGGCVETVRQLCEEAHARCDETVFAAAS
jgi:bacterioferritin-associated ferredoxin